MRSIEHNRQSRDIHGVKRSTPETEKSEMLHRKANITRESISAIDAELRVQGNPDRKYVLAPELIGCHISIVVINPFSLYGSNDNNTNSCGDWVVLAKTSYNNVLSNRFWMIMGVNHQIKEGSYTTTFKVRLKIPGIDEVSGKPIGGDDLAWKPPVCPTKEK